MQRPLVIYFHQPSAWLDALTFKKCAEEDQHDNFDVENKSLTLLPSSEAIFDHLNELEKFIYDSNTSDASYLLRKSSYVSKTDKKNKMK